MIEFFGVVRAIGIGKDADGSAWAIRSVHCPSCSRIAIFLANGKVIDRGDPHSIFDVFDETLITMVQPRGSSRLPCPVEVPAAIAGDYKEACIVLPDSAKASAALSRRCLQHLLRETARVQHQDLAREIQEVLDRGKLPSHISEILDAVRNIGNFAAHPLKSSATGNIVDVEPGEAELNLDVIESLFDFFYVQPAITKKKRDALNAKLQAAGKPPIKQ